MYSLRPPSQSAAQAADGARVLTKATLRAADLLGLTQGAVARIIGVSPATVSRMERGLYLIELGTKQAELAALLVRLYRSLDAIVGNSEADRRLWMGSQNEALGMPPRDAIETVDGLTFAVRYLDGARALT
jgi:transcriptional regulator with XRE-family HTH domain